MFCVFLVLYTFLGTSIARSSFGGCPNDVITSLQHVQAHTSWKQILAGSGNVLYRQDKNAGSVNNQNAVNNQAANSLKRGPGFGNAAIAQQNSQTQAASTNPVTPTVQIYSPSATTSVTGTIPASEAALPLVQSLNNLNFAGGSGLFRASGLANLIDFVLPVTRGVQPPAGILCSSQMGGSCSGGVVASSRASGGVLMPL